MLRKGQGQSTFQFTKIVEKISKQESKIASTLKTFGEAMMAPVIANFDRDVLVKRKQSQLGQLAKRVAKKASFLSNSLRTEPQTNHSNVSNSKSVIFKNLKQSSFMKYLGREKLSIFLFKVLQ